MSMVQSIVVSSKDQQKRDEKIAQMLQKYAVSVFDQTLIASEKTIGIEDIRGLQKNIFLKPLQGTAKAVIFDLHTGITIEAQNAMLKTLEEPPDHTIIVLSVPSIELLLPTIVSRCTIIELETGNAELTDKETDEYRQILASLQEDTGGDKLKISQDNGKTREDALLFLENLIVVGRNLLLQAINHQNGQSSIINGKLLSALQKTHTVIKTTNVSPRFALENLFLCS